MVYLKIYYLRAGAIVENEKNFKKLGADIAFLLSK
jgi:hypothetical protein